MDVILIYPPNFLSQGQTENFATWDEITDLFDQPDEFPSANKAYALLDRIQKAALGACLELEGVLKSVGMGGGLIRDTEVSTGLGVRLVGMERVPLYRKMRKELLNIDVEDDRKKREESRKMESKLREGMMEGMKAGRTPKMDYISLSEDEGEVVVAKKPEPKAPTRSKSIADGGLELAAGVVMLSEDRQMQGRPKGKAAGMQ